MNADTWLSQHDDTDKNRRVARDGERLFVRMSMMDATTNQTGGLKMATVKYTLNDGEERSITTHDAAAVQAIEALQRENEGLRGQLAAMDSLVHRSSPGPSNIADAARASALAAHEAHKRQIAMDQDPTTPSGARRAALSNAWKQTVA